LLVLPYKKKEGKMNISLNEGVSGLKICKYCIKFKECLSLSLKDLPSSYIKCEHEEYTPND
jgi:hypothetical protein